jgi:hypothetical protein
MIEMDQIQKTLLDLMLKDSHGEDGIDSLAFRAEHFDQIEQIDYLESVGFIRRENERYFVSLTALPHIDNEQARRLLDWSEAIFQELRAHYQATQREPLSVITLAECLGISLADACEALSYMVEGSWWKGRSNSFSKTNAPYIQPSEQILGFRRFSDVIRQLQSLQAEPIYNRQVCFADPLAFLGSDSSAPVRLMTAERRQKPEWLSELPASTQLLLDETYCASSNGLKALSAMGIRAVIDDVCLDLVGDVGSFDKKLQALRNRGYISDRECAVLAAAIDVGSASAHRGHVPDDSDIAALFEITEHILKAQYVLPKAAERLKGNTPDRPKK